MIFCWNSAWMGSYFEKVTLSFEFCTHGNRSLHLEKLLWILKAKISTFLRWWENFCSQMVWIRVCILLCMYCGQTGYINWLIVWMFVNISALFWFCFWECVALSWGYGVENIYNHIEDMLGRKINGWLKICWTYITPSVILVSS